jgi:dipeptidyl aminopeptidase/acylaminoacyl peptidase
MPQLTWGHSSTPREGKFWAVALILGAWVAFNGLAWASDGAAFLTVLREVQLTFRPSVEERPDWSPDGRRIIFDSRVGHTTHIWVMSDDGSNKVEVTKSHFTDGGASFSPDGRSILFYSSRSGSLDIWVMDSDGSNNRRPRPGPLSKVEPRREEGGLGAPHRPREHRRLDHEC